MITKKIKSLFHGDSIQAKISKGIAWTFFGTMISKVFLLIVFIIIARIITVEEYGQVGILRNAILTFSMLSVASFGITVTRYMAIYKDRDLKKTNRILTLTRSLVTIISFFIAMGIYVFSEEISIYLLNNIELNEQVKVLSIAVFFTSLNGYQNGALAGLEKFKEISFINVINGLLSFPILLAGAYYWQVAGIVVALALISFLLWSLSFYYLHFSMKEANLHLDFSELKKELKLLYEFSLPAFLSGIMLTPAYFIMNSMLAHQPNGYIELGIFNAAFFFTMISKTFIQIIGQVLYPYAMKEFGKENRGFEYFNNITPWIIGIVVNLPLILFPKAISMLYGNKYANEEFYISLIFIAFSNIVVAHRQGIGRNFAAANLMWWSVLSNSFWATISIVFAYVLIEYGSVGLAAAVFFGYVFNTMIFIPFYLRRNLIDKELLVNKYYLIIWFLLIISSLVSIYLDSIYLRVLYFILISYFGYKLFKKSWEVYSVR